MKWPDRFLAEAKAKAEWSKDPTTKVGAIAILGRRIIATGYNGFPERTDDNERLYENRETKLWRTVHAEINLVCQAARYGVSLDGATVYTTFHPCANCAGALINAGIKTIFYDASLPIPERWVPNMKEAAKMLREADVNLYPMNGPEDVEF